MGTPIIKGYSSLVEQVGSGELRLGERITYRQIFDGTYADCMTFANSHPRASIFSITLVSLGLASFIVDDCTAARSPKKASMGMVTCNYTYLGSVPPPEFSCVPFEINPPIERSVFFQSSGMTASDFQLARMEFNADTAAGLTSVQNVASTSSSAAYITALENKWLMGQQTYYQAGFKIQYSWYSYSLSGTMCSGGIIQAPAGIVPSSYLTTVPNGLSWLRQADELSWNNGVWKTTWNFMGAPGGWWDSDLY